MTNTSNENPNLNVISEEDFARLKREAEHRKAPDIPWFQAAVQRGAASFWMRYQQEAASND